jgi:imidazolonepropionase-like amidohydrolase
MTNMKTSLVGLSCAVFLLSGTLTLAQDPAALKPTQAAGQQPDAPPAAPAAKKAPDFPIELEADRKPALHTGGNVFLKNGTVVTVTKGVLLNTDILVQNGKIAAIGKGLTPPPGIAIIDATGKFVTPGIIDAHSHIAEDGTNEGTDSITAEVRIHDVIDPESISLYRGLSTGVTTSLLLHGSANPIGGQSVVVKMKWNTSVDDMIVPDAPRMVKFALGENVKQSGGRGGTRFPTTRMGVEAVYRRAFAEAKTYMAEWQSYETAKQSDPNAVPPRRDLRLETIAGILKREIWVQCHCYRADEMLMMVRLSQEYGFKIGALQHALEAYKIAPELLAAHIPISTFADAWAYKIEAQDAIPYNAALCERAGIITSVNSDNTEGTYHLNLEAAKAMKFGNLSEEEAWKLVTINPAIQLGIDKRTGSLETGKDGDIAVWDGHPLSVYSKCVTTLVEGEVYFQRRDAYGVDKTSTASQSVTPSLTEPYALPVPPESRTYAIVGGTIHPVSGPDIPNGTLIVEDGHIKALGKGIAVPKGAFVVHAQGLQVYPGMIDSGSELGLSEIEQLNATLDNSELGAYQPDLMALTAVLADSEHIPTSRCDGITATMTHPGSGGGGGRFGGGGSVILGQGAVMNLAGWTPELMKIKSPGGLYVNFPESRGAGRRGGGGLPADFLAQQRTAQTEQTKKIKEYFDQAKRYVDAKGQGGITQPIDPRMEAMIPYITGKLPVVFNVATAAGIKNAIAFAEMNGLKAIIAGGAEAGKVADLLAQKKVPVIYTLPIDNSLGSYAPRNEYDPYDTIFATPALLQRAGVSFCFASGNSSFAKNLPTQAGITCAFGLSHDAALKALTTSAAAILGVSDVMGSLEPGKLANVIVTDGDPMEVTTHLHNLFIAGKPIALENKHTHLYQTYLQRLPALKTTTSSTARKTASAK